MFATAMFDMKFVIVVAVTEAPITTAAMLGLPERRTHIVMAWDRPDSCELSNRTKVCSQQGVLPK